MLTLAGRTPPRLLLALLWASSLALLAPRTAAAEALSPEQARMRIAGDPTPRTPGRVSVLVHLEPAADRGALRAFAREQGGRVHYEYKTVLPRVVNLRDLPEAALPALAQLPGVVRIEPDTFHENVLELHDSIPLINGLQSQIAAAGLSATGSGVRICVVDTGIDTNHLMYDTRIDAGAGFDFENNDPDPEDDNGHGAHVSGIALGRSGLSVDFGCFGSEPFQGVAPEATLIGVKVLNSAGGGTTSNIIAGIDHCADPALPGGQADVINLSIGTGQFSGSCDGQHSWADAANGAAAAGVVVVAAAGNEGFGDALASPACGSQVMAIGATYDESFPNCEDATDEFVWCFNQSCRSNCVDTTPAVDDLICFSNQSSDVDVAAPGCVTFSAEFSDPAGNIISGKCGTSMASPHVAGLAALILEVDPAKSVAEIRQVIRDGAIDLGTPGFDPGYGHGRIDVVGSLSLLVPDVCGNGTCGAAEDACGCPGDCGPPAGAEAVCTDGLDDDCDGLLDCADGDCFQEGICICDADAVCEVGETCTTCATDCFTGSGASCGNGVCETADGEDCVSCPADCNGEQGGNPFDRFCCGDGDGQGPVSCADSRCTTGGFACSSTPTIGSCCGDAVCEATEDETNCAVDCAPCSPTTELCDGLDNDCDFLIDEDFARGEVCTVGLGECSASGVTICSQDGLGVECDGAPGTPSAELCDGLDNDCDGSPDEDFVDLGDACTVGLGECLAAGIRICTLDGSATECAATPGPPTSELCDGLDNDCDGAVDEDFTGLGGACTIGLGECQAPGTTVCSADGTTTECDGTPGDPAPEVCDSLDNDCDGEVDEGAASGSCDCGDVNLDGFVDQADAAALRLHLAQIALLPSGHEDECPVIGGPRPCDVREVVVLMRALGIPALPPGVAPVCPAALP